MQLPGRLVKVLQDRFGLEQLASWSHALRTRSLNFRVAWDYPIPNQVMHENLIEIEGWAFHRTIDVMTVTVVASQRGRTIAQAELTCRLSRPDVLNTFQQAPIDAGFSGQLQLANFDARRSIKLELIVTAKDFSSVRLSRDIRIQDIRAGMAWLYSAEKMAKRDYVAEGVAALPPAKIGEPLIIALYLPQFHEIPENNDWWGKGFTEWTNVARGLPYFKGHYQPHIPADLGFYDLSNPATIARQADLARQYGISGFCIYYYWFSGKRLLNTPLDLLLQHHEIEIDFCVCWANENWSRKWDGLESDVLIAQRNLPGDYENFIADVAPMFADPRYIRVNSRPLLVVYRVDQLDDPVQFSNTCRTYATNHGYGNPYMVMAQTFGSIDPKQYGFDAALGIPPHQIGQLAPDHDITGKVQLLNQEFSGYISDYQKVVDRVESSTEQRPYPFIPGVMPGWDNTARKQQRAHIFAHASPASYRTWLAHTLAQVRFSPADHPKLVFVNAWNEWAEGAHLEPDRRYGHAFLQATAEALLEARKEVHALPKLETAVMPAPRSKIAVALHLHYPELWNEVSGYLRNLAAPFDLYVTFSCDHSQYATYQIQAQFPLAHIFEVENAGRDVLPFVKLLPHLISCGYDAVCKIHGKKSLYLADGTAWRNGLLLDLLGSTDRVSAITHAFETQPELGVVGSKQFLFEPRLDGGSNLRNMKELRGRLQKSGLSADFAPYFAGTMFWFRPAALKPLADLHLQTRDFETQKESNDGTIAHAIERMINTFAMSSGFRYADTLFVTGATDTVALPIVEPRNLRLGNASEILK